MRFLFYIPFLFIFISLISSPLSYVKNKFLPECYIFDPDTLQGLVKDTLEEYPDGNNTVLFNSLGKKFKETYGPYVNELNFEDWIFSNAGGAMGTFFIFHASFTEYLIIFGTAIGTEGHTGHHLADDYFIIVSGEQSAAYAGENMPTVSIVLYIIYLSAFILT